MNLILPDMAEDVLRRLSGSEFISRHNKTDGIIQFIATESPELNKNNEEQK